jgi:hypothetical protein
MRLVVSKGQPFDGWCPDGEQFSPFHGLPVLPLCRSCRRKAVNGLAAGGHVRTRRKRRAFFKEQAA